MNIQQHRQAVTPQTGTPLPLRISMLTTMPTPYMQDMFGAMAASGLFDLRAFYLHMVMPNTHWGHASLPEFSQVLPNRFSNLAHGRIHCDLRAFSRLMRHQPEIVVIGGYFDRTNQWLMRRLHAECVPWIFWGEIPGLRNWGWAGRTLRRWAQRPVIRWPHAIGAIGLRAVASYRALVQNRCPVENLPYVCNLDDFFRESRPAADPAAGPRFLYCGQLIDRKGIDLLLGAFVPLARRHPGATLTLVGEGPLKPALQAMVPPDVSRQVVFAGFQPVAELPKWFATADVFVLPSRHDGWGVVVNQAIAAGLAVICSDAVGAAVDLVQVGENGFIFPAGETAALAECLENFVSGKHDLERMQASSRAIAARWTPPIAARRWWEFANRVLGRVEQPAGEVAPVA